MNIILNDVEARVLGCLIEKEKTTPDYYPLTLNALTNACNQKSNRRQIRQFLTKQLPFRSEAKIRGFKNWKKTSLCSARNLTR